MENSELLKLNIHKVKTAKSYEILKSYSEITGTCSLFGCIESNWKLQIVSDVCKAKQNYDRH